MGIRGNANLDNMTRTASLPSVSTSTFIVFARRSADRNTFSGLWDLSSAALDYYALCTNSDGTTVCVWDSIDDLAPRISIVNTATNTWYAFAITRSSNNLAAYFKIASNPSLTSSGTSTGETHTATGATLKTWGTRVSGEFWNGVLAGFKVWNAELSLEELNQECNQLMPFRTNDLFGFWPFTTSDAGLGGDISGNGNDLTPDASATFATENNPPVPWRLGARKSRIWIPP